MRLVFLALERACLQLGINAESFRAVFDDCYKVEQERAARAAKPKPKAEPKPAGQDGG
jgi:hypothetical protein